MPATTLLIALFLAGPVRTGRADAPKLEQGQKLFGQGDFDGALKMLDGAAAEGGDAATVEKVQLLRAQCLAARQEFVRAEEAFALALEANPEAALDPARVDPTVVKLLESVRGRLTGTLFLGSTPAGASLLLDGRTIGLAPQTLTVPIGRHRLEASWGEGATQSFEFQLKPHRELRVEWVQAGQAGSGDGLLAPKPVRPFGDLRGMLEPTSAGTLFGGLEFGGGIELAWFRIGLYGRVYPYFGLIPRFQLALPVWKSSASLMNVVLEAAVPLSFFSGGFGLGLGGGGGLEYCPIQWFAGYLLIGGRHNFLWPRNDPTAFTATAGVRLRVP